MSNCIHSFNKLLEQYLFSVSTTFIEWADPQTQADLINFISRVDTGAASTDEVSLAGQPGTTEWQQVLELPVDLQSVYNQWLIGVTRQRLHRQEAYIARIDETIRFTHHQGQCIQDTFFKEPFRTTQLNRNKGLLAQYQGYLATACLSKQVLLTQLSQLAQLQAVDQSRVRPFLPGVIR